MAREALTVIGTVVGAWFGAPQLGYAIGSLVGNMVDPQRIKGPRLGELPLQSSSEGGFRNVVYGTSWVPNLQIIDFSEPERVIREEQQGKGGPVVETERVLRTYAIGIGEPADAILMLRRDGQIVYDVRPGSTMLRESAQFASKFRFYTGSEDQLPDPDLEALPHNGAGNTPSYRGTSYFVIVRDDVTDRQGSIPTWDAVVARASEAVIGEPTGPQTLPESTDFGRLGVYVHVGAQGDLSIMTEGWGPTVDLGNGLDPGDSYVVWPGLDAVGDAGEGDYIENAGDSAGDTRLWMVGANEEGWAVSADNGYGDCKLLYRGRIKAYLRPTNTAPDSWWYNELGFNPEYGGLVWFYGGSVYIGIRTTGNGAGTLWDRVCRWPLSGTGGAVTALQTVTNASGDGSGQFFMHLDLEGSIWILDNTGALKQYDGLLGLIGSTALPSAMTADVRGFGVDGNILATYVQNPVSLEDELVLWNIADEEEIGRYGLGDYQIRTFNHRILFTGTQIIVQAGDQVWEMPYAGARAGDSTTLQAIVADVCDRCGIPSGKLDLTALTDEVAGLTLGGAYDGAGAISMLMPAYLFDLQDADKTLTAVKRGGAVKATITADDLIEEPDEGTLRGQDIEYPRLLNFKYYNPGQNYAAPVATAFVPTPAERVRGEASIDLPIAMDETVALNTVTKMLKVMWEDLNGEVVLALPAGPFAWLTPSDCLGLSLREQLYRVRVEKVEEQGRVLKVTARRDRQSAYTSNLTAVPLPSPNPPPASLAGPTDFLVLNCPPVVDSDDRLGVRIAVGGRAGTAWRGAQVELSSDNGETWTVLGTFTTPARIGRLLEPLPAAPAEFVDTSHTLVLRMLDGRPLEGVTDVQLLQEGNGAALVLEDGTTELIQYRDVAEDSNGDQLLSYLLRGRQTTTPVDHPVSRRFVVLSTTSFVPLPVSLIGRDLLFRVTSVGNSPELGALIPFTWDPALSQTEFAPALLEVARAGGFITATWSARPRLGTEVTPVHSVNFEGYRVTFTDGVTTVTVDTTETELAQDDSAFGSPVTVTVQGLNRITGPGPGTSENV